MTCSKSQLLALLSRLRKDLSRCRDIKCVKKIMNEYIELVEDAAETEAWRELIRP